MGNAQATPLSIRNAVVTDSKQKLIYIQKTESFQIDIKQLKHELKKFDVA